MTATNEKTRTLVGRVTSDKREKTIAVRVEWSRRHPTYGKVLRKHTTCHVHDQDGQAKLGDLVEIKQIRPISKSKTWGLVRVLEQANQ